MYIKISGEVLASLLQIKHLWADFVPKKKKERKQTQTPQPRLPIPRRYGLNCSNELVLYIKNMLAAEQTLNFENLLSPSLINDVEFQLPTFFCALQSVPKSLTGLPTRRISPGKLPRNFFSLLP